MTDKEYIAKLREDYHIPEKRACMTDYDRLALLLSYTNCAKNLRLIMADIADKFMTVKDVYRCSYPSLMQIDKMTHHGACAILLAARAMTRPVREIKFFKKASDYEDFFKSRLSMTTCEELWAAIFSDDGKLIAAKKMSVGSSCHADIFVGDLIEFAASANCRRMVIAHSHPYIHNADMSREDANATEYLRSLLKDFNIDLFGHVIVSENKAKFYASSDKEK